MLDPSLINPSEVDLFSLSVDHLFYKMKTCSVSSLFFPTSSFKYTPFASIRSAFVRQDAFETRDNRGCSLPMLGPASDCSGHSDRMSLARGC